MTTEKLDDQGLKPEDEVNADESTEEEEISPEEQAANDAEAELEKLSNPQTEDSEKTEEDDSEQSTGESESEESKEEDEGSTDELPENVDEKTKQAFIKQRLKYKERIKELEEKAESDPPSEKIVEKKEPEEAEAPKASAGQVLDLHLRAMNEELTDDEISQIGNKEKVIALTEEALAKHLTASQIYEAMQNAIATNSPDKDDIIDIGNKYLSLARFREDSVAKEESDKQASVAQVYETELKQVSESFPDFMKEDTLLSKFGKEWDKRNIGTVDESGKKIQGQLNATLAEYLVSHPMEHAKMISDAFSLSAKSTEHAEKEIKKAAKDKAALDSGESGSPPSGASGKETRTEADILADLEKMSALG